MKKKTESKVKVKVRSSVKVSKPQGQGKISNLSELLIVGMLLMGIILSSLYNYLIFHSLAELFSIIIALCVFLIAWQTRKQLNNSFYLIIGISLLYIGFIDLLHTLSYTGMNIFPDFGTNLPTQLWISARYIQSGSLIAAFVLRRRRLNPNLLMASYFFMTTTVLLLIFTGNFPNCYIDGIGLTQFKIWSEYIIISIISVAIFLAIIYRHEIGTFKTNYIILSSILLIISEFLFTFYMGPHEIHNLAGHMFKILAFYFIFKAFLQMAITHPLSLLLSSGSSREKLFENERNRFLNILNASQDAICLVEEDNSISYFNNRFEIEFGSPNGVPCYQILYNRANPCENCDLKDVLAGEVRRVEYHLPDYKEKIFDVINTPYVNLDGKVSKLKILRDMSLLREAQQKAEVAEIKYKNIIDYMPLGIHMYKLNETGDLIFTGANPAADEILGIENSQYIGKELTTAFPNLADTKIQTDFLKLASEGGFTHTEFLTYEDDKVQGMFENFNFQTTPGQMATIFREITEAKRMEKELEEYRGQLEDLVEKRTKELIEVTKNLKFAQKIAKMGNWEWNLKTNHLTFSEEVSSIFEAKTSEISNDWFLERVHPDDKEKVLSAIREAINGKKEYNVEHRILLENGDIKHVNQIGIIEHDEKQNPVRITGTLQDTTEIFQARHRFIDFKNAAIDGFFILDKDLNYLDINDEGLSIFPPGTKKQDIVGKNIIEISPDIKESGRYDLYLNVLKTGEPVILEDVLTHEIFGEKHVYIKAFKLGEDLGVIVSDFTELRRAERRFMDFKEAAPITFIIFDHQLNYVDINSRGLENFPKGVTKMDLIGKNLVEVHPPIKGTRRLEIYKEVLRTGKSMMFDDVVPGGQFGDRHFSIKIFKLGTFLGMISWDITEMKQIEMELKVHKENLEHLVEERNQEIYDLAKFPRENPLPVLRIENRKIIFANKSASKSLGLNEGDSIPDYIEKPLNDTITQTEPVVIQISHNNATFLLSIINVKETSYINIYGMDISPLIRTQERLREFISNISHEVRTPLTVLNQIVENLNQYEEKMDTEQKKYFFKTLMKNINNMNELVEDLMVLARVDEDHLESKLESLDINSIVHSLVESLKPKRKMKELKISLDLPENLVFRADKKQFIQILRILIDNSIKYSNERGKIEIKITKNYKGKYNPDEKQGILIEVSDDGIGIPEDDIPKLFKRFHRGKNVGDISGTGLGLPIARELIKRHGGIIDVQSELNKGTSFYIFLPKDR